MKRQLRVLLVTALLVLAIFSVGLSVPSSASANGAAQISGIGSFPGEGECTDAPAYGADFANIMEGDLEGCLYVFVETFNGSPSGTYRETGTEIFVGSYQGEVGTFMTTYRFEAKFEDLDTLTGEIFGRCQHPIVVGSGTGVFEGVTGRLDFKDDVEAGNFPYRGHLNW